MNQFLVIIRGAPASGKTTIAKLMRNYAQKIAWLKVDNFKDFFSGLATLAEQADVDACAIATLEHLLNSGFSVVMEKIFFDTTAILKAIALAEKPGIPVKVFQIKCPLELLQERDKHREGVPEGCRKPLGDETVRMLFEQLEKTFYPGAIPLDTTTMTAEECVGKIYAELAKH